MAIKDHKPRKPMQVSPEFEKKLKEVQRLIRMKRGENISLRDLTENVANHFDDIEKAIVEIDSPKFDLGIKFDRRRR